MLCREGAAIRTTKPNFKTNPSMTLGVSAHLNLIAIAIWESINFQMLNGWDFAVRKIVSGLGSNSSPSINHCLFVRLQRHRLNFELRRGIRFPSVDFDASKQTWSNVIA
ncbi:hypothetical protein PCI56_13460 [Plesiomonas shigelloides subsp. oncorhynchi]|nr:hypothetical protein [Plesiomonas shigelloides]